MKNLLLSGIAFIWLASPAHAVTAVFCGPQSEGGSCESGTEFKVFLDDNKKTTLGFGQVGSQKSPITMDLASDGGMLNVELDLANGFATITPAHGFVDFNGIDVTIPGFTFTDLVFDVQLTPVTGQTIDSFDVSAFSSAHILDGLGLESDKADTDKEFSVTAQGGAFDEVNIDSLKGFDEIKHIEVSGLAPIPIPEPSTWVMFITGFGLLGLFARAKSRQRLSVQL